MSIFDQTRDVELLKAERLLRMATSVLPDGAISSAYVWEKLLAEERMLEHTLRTLFAPREVVPDSADPAEVAALVAAGASVIREPGYDYDPDSFTGVTWGTLQLRHKPIIDVHSITFDYPGPNQALYQVPPEWVRADKKYGRFDLVPTTNLAVNFPLASFALQVLGGGRRIPFMVQVRYSAGIPDIRTSRPEIVDTIKKMAVLSILDDQYFPTSYSTSVDGLSQTISMDTAKLRETLDKRLTTLSQVTSGIQFAVA